jgi:hypothetical protein
MMIQNKGRIACLLQSAYFPYIVVGIALLLTFQSLWLGWFVDDIWHRLGYAHSARIDAVVPEDIRMTGPMNSYAFFWGDETEKIQRMKDRGIYPWWVDSHLHIAFWRPLSGCLLWLDYHLWPQTPLLMHAQSLLWFTLLVFVSAKLFARYNTGWAAGLALLLFSIDDSHGWPVAFLANRHALVGAVFGVAAFYAFTRWQREQSMRWGVLSWSLFAFSLLASEAGVAGIALYLAYACVFDEKPTWRKRATPLLPYFLITVVWRVVYNWLCYGASGSEIYIDPIRSPLQFTGAALQRLPGILLGVLGFPPSDIYLILPDNWVWMYAAGVTVVLLCCAWVVFPFWRHCRIAWFWLLAMLFAGIPLCSAFPGNRNLEFVALGAAGFMAQVVYTYFHSDAAAHISRFRMALIRCGIGLLVLIHLVIAPFSLATSSLVMGRFQTDLSNTLQSLDNETNLEEKDLLFMNTPSGLFFAFMLPLRLLDDLPLPARVRTLTPGIHPITISRTGTHTLRIESDTGFLPRAERMEKIHKYGFLFNAMKRFDRLVIHKDTTWSVGQTYAIEGMEIKITKVTDANIPKEIEYTFTEDLDSDTFLWYRWDHRTWRFIPMPPVPLGDALRVDWDS